MLRLRIIHNRDISCDIKWLMKIDLQIELDPARGIFSRIRSMRAYILDPNASVTAMPINPFSTEKSTWLSYALTCRYVHN